MKSCVVQRIQADSDNHVQDVAARGEAKPDFREEDDDSGSKEDDEWRDDFEEGMWFNRGM